MPDFDLYAWTSADDSSKTIYTKSPTPTNSDDLYDSTGNVIEEDYLNNISWYTNMGYGNTSLSGWTITSTQISFNAGYEPM